MAEISLDTAKALLDAGKINQSTFDLLSNKSTVPATKDTLEDLPVDTSNKPDPRLSAMVENYKSKGYGGLAGSPETRAQADLAQLQKLESVDPGSLSNSQLSRMRELQRFTQPNRAPQSAPASQEEAMAQVPSALPSQPQIAQPQAAPQAPVLASDVVQQQPQVPEALQPGNIAKGLEGAYSQMQEANLKAGAAGIKQANEEAAYLQQAQINADKLERQRLEKEAIRQQALKEKTDKLQLMVDQFGSEKIDPSRFWKDRTTDQKIMTGIGLFLGAFGSNGNSAVKVVQDAINRDIDAQKAEIERSKTGVLLQNNVLSSMREQFGDERAAEAAARLAALNQVDNRLKSIAARYRGPMIEAQVQKADAELELAKKKEMMAFGKAVQMSPAFSQMDNMMQSVMTKIPESERPQAIKELGEYNGIKSSVDRAKQIYKEMIDLQSTGSRLGSPIQSKMLLDTAKAKLFPIVKSIMGEKMSEGDVENFLKPYLVGFIGAEKIGPEKLNSLVEALEAQVPGRTPLLSGMGIIPKKIKTGAPVK